VFGLQAWTINDSSGLQIPHSPKKLCVAAI